MPNVGDVVVVAKVVGVDVLIFFCVKKTQRIKPSNIKNVVFI